MTQPAPENPQPNVAPGNGQVAPSNLPEIDYDKLAQSLKSVLPQSTPAPAPVAPSNNSGFATKEEIDALPEKMVNAFREAFTLASPPAAEPPKEEEAPKEPGKKSSLSEWWFGK